MILPDGFRIITNEAVWIACTGVSCSAMSIWVLHWIWCKTTGRK